MKLLIASDIHGSAYYCEKLLEAFSRENADLLLLLGDLLYHGPRNGLSEGYDTAATAEMLNVVREKIFCVRGNCDTEVDQMVLGFPMLADYGVVYFGERRFYLSHGHRYGENTPPPLQRGDVLLCGHTHVPKHAVHGGYIFANPGSVSLPKEGSEHGYMTYSKGALCWKKLDGTAYDTFELPEVEL